jgi:hypothetical protein
MAGHKYLLGAPKHFLADAHDRACAQKRGGTREILSLDALAAEESYGWEPPMNGQPNESLNAAGRSR